MNARPDTSRRLRLESLETRTLLAADVSDPFGLVADFNLAMHAVSGTGDVHASFSTNFGNHQLVLTGTANDSLTIDLSQLPDFITNIRISSFASVSFVGTDKLEALYIENVGTLSAKDLTITDRFTSNHVEAVSLESIGSTESGAPLAMAVLYGDATKLTAQSLDNAVIVSDLHSLTLLSESKTLSLISLNNEQSVYLKYYLPDLMQLSGLPESSIHLVIPDPGDSSGGGTIDPSSGGNDNPTSPDTGHLVIVSFPLDDRTREFIAELRAALDSSSGDPEKVVADFMAHRRLSTEGTSPLLAESASRSESAVHIAHSDEAGDLTSAPIPHLNVGLPESMKSSLGALDLALSAEKSLADASLSPDRSPSVGLTFGHPNVDISWPSLGAAPVAEASVAHDAGAGTAVSDEVTMAENLRAFGNYIVERLTAEFSPGQQSLVLLVDPQPSRSLDLNRKSTAVATKFGIPLATPFEASVV